MCFTTAHVFSAEAFSCGMFKTWSNKFIIPNEYLTVLRVVILFFLKFFRFAVEVEDKGMEPEPTFNDEEIVETEQNATIEVKYHNHILSINNKTLRQFWK